VEFQILGPLEVRDGNRVLPVGGGQRRALLALLLLSVNETVSRDRLMYHLWGEHPPSTAAKALQGHVSALRKLLEPDRPPGTGGRVLVTRGGGYELRLEDERLDLERFERLRNEGRRALAEGDPVRAASRLREALALWRGPPLADFAYEPFAQTEIARLEELRLTTLEDRLEADLASNAHGELVGELEALVREHPLRERLRGQLMLALYRAGRQAEALDVYQASRQALVEELGIEPGRRLRELHQAILRQEPGLDRATTAEAPPKVGTDTARGVFVGREAELAELRTGLENALGGRGRLIMLVGEPGIGKSRLADELIHHARGRGAQVLTGRCWEAGGAPAYWPWTQSLRAYVRAAEPEALVAQLGVGAPDLAQIVPELRDIFPGLPEPPSIESDGARFRLFDATAEFLRSASESQPLVFVLDDLHAADAPSLLLLQFLTRELGSARLLIVAACRDVDPVPGEALSDLLAAVAREPVTRRLSLTGLGEQDVVEFVRLTASGIASSELVAALHEETEGNPFFLGEMVRLLDVEGVRSNVISDGRLSIPKSVRDVIARRLTHLSEECNRLLTLASVYGREFVLGALGRMSGVSEDELLETLDEAMAARVVSDVPGAPGRLRFAHVLIRDTLFEALTPPRRVQLHRRAVEALEALYGHEPGPHLAELANHSIGGTDFAKGLDYARRAGDRSLALLAYEEAARLYTMALRALHLSDHPDERTRCELLLSLGVAEGRAGNTPAANTALLDAAAIARRLGMPRQLALAAAEYSGRMVWVRAADDARLVPLLEEGLAALPRDDVRLRARLLARLAGAFRDEPSRDRRDALSREAVELARRTADPAALAHALDGRAMAILAPDTVAESLAIASELVEVADEIRDREGLVHGYMQRVSVRVVVGDVGAAEDDLAAATPMAEHLRQPAHLWDICAARAMLALAAGKLSEAEALVERAKALGERTLPSGAIPVYRLQRYTLLEFRGRLDEVEPEIRDLVVRYPARPVFRCVLVHLQARLGRVSEARQALDELGVDDFSVLPFDQEWLFAMGFLAEATALLADPGSASVLYDLLAPWAALNVADPAEGIRGSASRHLGLLATATRRWEAAEHHFEEAAAMNAKMGARPWLAHTQHDYARMLLARDGPGDREGAQELLGTAVATYRELGMESYAAAASALAQQRRLSIR
jgi:DNA-binding SARP family transcriptional activator